MPWTLFVWSLCVWALSAPLTSGKAELRAAGQRTSGNGMHLREPIVMDGTSAFSLAISHRHTGIIWQTLFQVRSCRLYS